MTDIERLIVSRCVMDFLEAGFEMSVYDGEDHPVYCSKDPAEIMDNLGHCDEEVLIVHGGGVRRGGAVSLVYGNDEWDVISDYHDHLDQYLTRTNLLIERMSA
jgi:hypothetical protein